MRLGQADQSDAGHLGKMLQGKEAEAAATNHAHPKLALLGIH